MFSSREISPIIIDAPTPLSISMEESSSGAHIDYRDNAVIQEIQIQLPPGSPGIPATFTLLQDKIIDIGLQGDGTPVVY